MFDSIQGMRIVYPGLKYGEALAKANITTLHSRRELLSRKLFKDIVKLMTKTTSWPNFYHPSQATTSL